MKIIGKTNSGYIVEASEDELARIDGHSSAYFRAQYDRGPRQPAFAIGTEVPVNKWWDFVATLRSREEALRKSGETMKSLGELVTHAWPAIAQPLEQTEGQ